MVALFLAFTMFNLVCLAGTGVMGIDGAGAGHVAMGVVAVMVCCGVHCVVFTYFIATAKWIGHAVEVKGLGPDWAAGTRSFKMMAFPAALVGIFSTFAAALAGAAVDNYGLSARVHGGMAWGCLGINALVAVVEYRAIVKNGRVIDRILAAPSHQRGMVAR